MHDWIFQYVVEQPLAQPLEVHLVELGDVEAPDYHGDVVERQQHDVLLFSCVLDIIIKEK